MADIEVGRNGQDPSMVGSKDGEGRTESAKGTPYEGQSVENGLMSDGGDLNPGRGSLGEREGEGDQTDDGAWRFKNIKWKQLIRRQDHAGMLLIVVFYVATGVIAFVATPRDASFYIYDGEDVFSGVFGLVSCV